MKSKEEIFKSNVDCNCRACKYDALKAMDLYAEQVAIEFVKWCSWKYLLGSDNKTWLPRFTDQRIKDNWKTTQQLFELFQQSLK